MYASILLGAVGPRRRGEVRVQNGSLLNIPSQVLGVDFIMQDNWLCTEFKLLEV